VDVRQSLPRQSAEGKLGGSAGLGAGGKPT